MPKIDLSNIQESTGSFKRLEPGTYVCKIVDAQLFDDPDKQYIRIEWDVAVGEYADIFKDAPFARNDFVSWKENALGMLKHKLACLTESNKGFDAEAAFYADDMAAFKGKVFGARVRERLYTKSDGTDGSTQEIGEWLRATEALTGTYEVMPPRDRRDARAQATQAALPIETPKPGATDVYDEDIPF